MKFGQHSRQFRIDLNIVLLEEERIHPESDLDPMLLSIWTVDI